MKLTTNIGRLLLTCSFVAITGCASLMNFSFASAQIRDIQEVKNEELLDNPLIVEGVVEKVIPLLDEHMYLLKDDTELIWVITKNQPPNKLEPLKIKGQLKNEKIVFEDEEYSEFYLEEIDRLVNSE